MDFTRDFLYRVDNLCSYLESIEYECSMRECVLIETGSLTMKNIIAIQEAEAEKTNAFFNGIMAAINTVHQRFEELFNMRYIKDKEYIEKYEAYLKEPVKAENISVYKYNTELLVNTSVPSVNFESIKNDLDDLLTAQKKLFPNLATNETADKFADTIKAKFRGEPSTEEKPTIKGSDFDMEKAANFVKNYINTKKKVASDKKALMNIVNAFKNAVKKAENDTKIEAQNNSFYSDVYGQVIVLEAEDDSSNTDNKTVDKPDNQAEEKSDKEKAVDDVMKDADGAAKEKKDSFGTNLKRTKNGINVVSKFFSAKMAICNECYKSYMEILKNHIGSYDESAKNPGKTEDKSEEKPKDEENELTPEEKIKAKEIVSDVHDDKGNVKNLNDEGKANFLSKLQNAVGKSKASKLFNKVISKIGKNKGDASK